MKPKQKFNIGDEVVHLGTDIGTRKGELFTIISDLTFKKMTWPDGSSRKVWQYELDRIEVRQVGALPEWLHKRDEPGKYSFDEIMVDLNKETVLREGV